MSEIDAIFDEMASLERKLDRMDVTMVASYQEVMIALRLMHEQIVELRSAMHLAQQPDEESARKNKTLREAYNQYIFVKNLALNNDK